MFKVKNGLCPEIMKDLFQFNTNPDNKNTFVIPRVRGEYMGKLSLRYFGPIVWETMLPDKYKVWFPDCNCRLCKTYVAQVGFVNVVN